MGGEMKTLQLTKYRFVMISISVLLIAGGLVVTMMRGGFNLGIDFQAGLNLRVEVSQSVSAEIEQVRSALSGMGGVQVQTVGGLDEQQFVIRVSDSGDIESFSTVISGQILSDLSDEFGAGTVTELENTYVGSRFSQDLTRNVVLLTSLAMLLILAYIWFRFKLAYAASAIIALVHDVSFMAIFVGAFQLEVSTATIAAALTIIGYSLNDTIVIFDRVRENENVMRESSLETIVNTSISQSLSRTLITSLTTLLAVAAIYIFATGTVQLFALNMMVGVLVGTYSSIFIASPVFLGWRRLSRKRDAQKDATRQGAPVTEKRLGEAKAATPATDQAVSAAERERAIQELTRKRTQTSGRSSSRAKRKKK